MNLKTGKWVYIQKKLCYTNNSFLTFGCRVWTTAVSG